MDTCQYMYIFIINSGMDEYIIASVNINAKILKQKPLLSWRLFSCYFPIVFADCVKSALAVIRTCIYLVVEFKLIHIVLN